MYFYQLPRLNLPYMTLIGFAMRNVRALTKLEYERTETL